MHIGQALKMACKSLWTNKLRSFLTMLGIIIGVFTVSLLTTVAQGVSDAVVSSIRSQSTLAVMMNMTNRMSFSEADNIIQGVQPKDTEADDYFKYCLVYTAQSIIANGDVTTDIDPQELSDSMYFEKLYTKDDFPEYDTMSVEEKGFADLLMMKKKRGALGTTIYAVENNFEDVYSLVYSGSFPKNSNEILVDETFVKSFIDAQISTENAIGEYVTFGIKNYTELKFTFNSEITTEQMQSIVSYISGETSISMGGANTKFNFDIIANSNGSKYCYNNETNELIVNIEIYKYMLNESVSSMLSFIPELASAQISVKDIVDTTNARAYKIVGVMSDEENSMFSNMSSSSDKSKAENSILMSYMSSMSSTKGSCYMLLDDDNLNTLEGEPISVKDANVTFAYFRYKNEDVMGSSTTNLVMAFATSGYGYLTEFMLISFSSVANIISKVMNILTIMLTVISVISLIVGGIGIMNIMLVAVTERTREIGIRKAIGAKKSSILTQFLVEALMLSIFGGIIGLGISAIGALIISSIMNITLLMPTWVILMSVGFCTAIGLIFGMFPAIKASNMQPIDALRRD